MLKMKIENTDFGMEKHKIFIKEHKINKRDYKWRLS